MRKAASKDGMILLFISSVVLVRSSGDISNQNCWPQAIDFYNSFVQTVCKNTSYESSDPNRWLPAVCKDICTVEINKSCDNKDGFVKFNLTNGMTSNFVVGDYSLGNCSACYEINLVTITCKSDRITCTNLTGGNNEKQETDISTTMSTSPQITDCSHSQNIEGKGTLETSSLSNFDTTRSWTHATTSKSTCIQEGYLVLALLLGLVLGTSVTLGIWLFKTKFVGRKLCVSQGSSVRNNTYDMHSRSSDAEIPRMVLKSEVYTDINEKKITKTRDDSNIYNHLHETKIIDSDFNDSPYDHAQCLTEIQSTPIKVLEDNYTHINK